MIYLLENYLEFMVRFDEGLACSHFEGRRKVHFGFSYCSLIGCLVCLGSVTKSSLAYLALTQLAHRASGTLNSFFAEEWSQLLEKSFMFFCNLV